MPEKFSAAIEIFLKLHGKEFSPPRLYVLQGFSLNFYRSWNTFVPHLTGWDGFYPDVKTFDKNTRKNLRRGLEDIEITSWIFYEEFIDLTAAVRDFSDFDAEIIVVRNDIFAEHYDLPLSADDLNFLSSVTYSSTPTDTTNELLNFYPDCRELSGHQLVSYRNRHFKIDVVQDIRALNFYAEIAPQIAPPDNFSSVKKISQTEIISTLCEIQRGAITDTEIQIYSDSLNIFDRLDIFNAFAAQFKVKFVRTADFSQQTASRSDYLEILRKYWGAAADFRFGKFYADPVTSDAVTDVSQEKIIDEIVSQCEKARGGSSDYRDMIVTAPTGAGKSIFFQLPGIYLMRRYKLLTIVVCPLRALMEDQVRELNGRFPDSAPATYINGDIPFQERQARLAGINDGKHSIIYLAPEYLLSYEITSIIGGRRIGLFVVDEAHLVTTWGRDFRVDYWFLGSYLDHLRNSRSKFNTTNGKFPVLCLTATAIFKGEYGTVGELRESLYLQHPILHIGYVRRDEIVFEINHPAKYPVETDKTAKTRLTLAAVEKFVRDFEERIKPKLRAFIHEFRLNNSGKIPDKNIFAQFMAALPKPKTIIYFPYTTQIDEIYNRLNPLLRRRVGRYHGSMSAAERKASANDFKDGKIIVMLASKAFGMGINIGDIENIYHYAPTGELSDYIQEIGRAARDSSAVPVGHAIIDYLSRGMMHFAQTLWGLSGLRQRQLRAMMSKLYQLYAQKNNRNLLFEPEIFSYLFGDRELDNTVKSGLMLLSTDLHDRYRFPVISVRPKSLFSTHYVVVPKNLEPDFLSRYGAFAKKIVQNYSRYIAGGKSGSVFNKKLGDIFEMDLGELWEKKFSQLTFANFKRKFFNEDIFGLNTSVDRIAPQIQISIHYEKDYPAVVSEFTRIAEALELTFTSLRKTFGQKNFTLRDFIDEFKKCGGNALSSDYFSVLLDLFAYRNEFSAQPASYVPPPEFWKFVNKNIASSSKNTAPKYSIVTQKFQFLEQNLRLALNNAVPSGKDYVGYISIPIDRQPFSDLHLLASLLQIFGLATYESVGGRNPKIFIQLNDPDKIRKLSTDTSYRNEILQKIGKRHARAAVIINAFMFGNFTDAERWDIIEQYFLGNDDRVQALLNIP